MKQRLSMPLKQRGLTLVELLVSMAITAMVMTGVIQTLLDNKAKFVLSDQLSLIQENARFAVEELSHEIRMAGFVGCAATANIANVLRDNQSNSFYQGFGIRGWDGDQSVDDFPNAFNADLWQFNDMDKADPDAVLIARAVEQSTLSVTTHNANAAVIDINQVHGIDAGEILSVATPDCAQVTIFQATGNNTTKIGHNQGSSQHPGNCLKKQLFGNFNCADTDNAVQNNLPPGSRLSRYQASAYYIGASSIDRNIPALYREQLQEVTGDATTRASELLIGVENLQLLYGIDSSSDQQANVYYRADAISGVAPLIWSNVVSVKFTLLLRSMTAVWDENRSFEFNGANYNDKFLRQQLTTTVVLRNQVLPNP